MAGTSYGVNSPLAVKAWAKKLFVEALKMTRYEQFKGTTGTDSLITLKTETQKAAGDRITIGLRMQLTGAGESTPLEVAAPLGLFRRWTSTPRLQTRGQLDQVCCSSDRLLGRPLVEMAACMPSAAQTIHSTFGAQRCWTLGVCHLQLALSVGGQVMETPKICTT